MSEGDHSGGRRSCGDELTVHARHVDDSYMRIALIAWACLGSAFLFSACTDNGGGSTSSSNSSSGTAGAGGASSSSSSSSSSSGGGAGGQGGCTTDAQCAPSGPCKSVACVEGACVENLVPAGTLVNVAEGDCKRQECNATGDVTDVIDDNDKPQDYNPCTIDMCSNGMPSNTPEMNGKACGTGQTNCQNGKCVGCKSDGNCPNGAICDMPVCDAQGVCGLAIDAGKLVSNVDPSDCFVQQCDAMGKVQTVSAPLENPMADTNECDIEVCGSNGIEHMAVTDGTVCSGSTECNPRACLSATCSNLPFPGMETAVAAQIPSDCKVDVCDGAGGIVSKNDDLDVPVDPAPGDCTLVQCVNGASTTTAAPAGAMCTTPAGLPGTCSATGVCS